jgi:hypothetical protein
MQGGNSKSEPNQKADVRVAHVPIRPIFIFGAANSTREGTDCSSAAPISKLERLSLQAEPTGKSLASARQTFANGNVDNYSKAPGTLQDGMTSKQALVDPHDKVRRIAKEASNPELTEGSEMENNFPASGNHDGPSSTDDALSDLPPDALPVPNKAKRGKKKKGKQPSS